MVRLDLSAYDSSMILELIRQEEQAANEFMKPYWRRVEQYVDGRVRQCFNEEPEIKEAEG
jgi:hypothetical protein